MESDSRPGLLERLINLLTPAPDDREELLGLLHDSFKRHLIDAEALSIIEGAIGVSDMPVRDVMVPRAQMDVVDLDTPIEQIIRFVIETTHSRFPVIGKNRDDVLGILLAKDLLRHGIGEAFHLRDALRPAVFIPEAKRLNVLLREFRASHNHMAIVVDEYGGVSGLVTIEDVLEQIVGDIDDEYDFDEATDNIVLDNAGRYRVKATTTIDDINTTFGTTLPGHDFDTIGGLIIHQLGRLPKRGEILQADRLRIQVLRADSRRVHTLLIDPQQVIPLET